MSKIIAGNFKSNLNRTQTAQYLQKLDSLVQTSDSKVFIFPSISSMVENNFKHITIGAQNCHYALNGAFTGEVTLEHLNELNINTILIAHSERRNLFGESDEICAKKFEFFKEHNFEIFYCIGENLETRNNKNELEFLANQLSKIDLKYDKLIIAYEPIWAIGTGINASAEQISKSTSYLKSLTNAPIIYGGSVNENNAKEILKISDGILVGSASLNIDKFYQMIKE